MTTITAPLSRLTAVGIVRSEWIKLRSLRSTVWSFAIVIVISIAFSLLFASVVSSDMGQVIGADGAQFVVVVVTAGISFSQLVVAVLGALVITGEYSTGMIRSTFAAVPHRIPALLGKALVLFVTTFVVGLISTFGPYFIVTPILASKGMESSIGDSDVFLPLIGGAFYLACVAIFSLAIGAILRNSAGGIAVALGVILVLPILVSIIPAEWATTLSQFLFSNAGTGFYSPGLEFDFWQNLAVVAGWLVVLFAGASLLLRRRDA